MNAYQQLLSLPVLQKVIIVSFSSLVLCACASKDYQEEMLAAYNNKEVCTGKTKVEHSVLLYTDDEDEDKKEGPVTKTTCAPITDDVTTGKSY